MITTDSNPNIEDRALRPLTVRLPTRLYDRLRELAREQGDAESAIIRRALRRELELETR